MIRLSKKHSSNIFAILEIGSLGLMLKFPVNYLFRYQYSEIKLSACNEANADSVKVGFTAPDDGNKLGPETYKFSISCYSFYL